jgi:calcium/proton exchanger
VAGIMSSLMIISSAFLVVPSILSTTLISAGDPTGYILSLSHATSIILLLFYGVYLYFSVKSHRHLFCEEEIPERLPLDPWAACVVLVIATVAVAACSDSLVDSIDGFVKTLHVSRAFIGLIIVPIVGNAGEYATTVKWAINGKLDLAIGVIVGSTLQIALFVTPFMVILGWIIRRDMSLQFDTFQTTTVCLSVLVVNCLVRDGRTNYFEGFLLIAT